MSTTGRLLLDADTSSETLSKATMNLLIGGFSASLMLVHLEYFLAKCTRINNGRPVWKIELAITGCLTGIIAIKAGCNQYQPWAAFTLGLIAGCSTFVWTKLLYVCNLDDPGYAVGTGLPHPYYETTKHYRM